MLSPEALDLLLAPLVDVWVLLVEVLGERLELGLSPVNLGKRIA